MLKFAVYMISTYLLIFYSMEDILMAAALEEFDDDDMEDAFVLHIFNDNNLGNRAESI